ncbi:shikimate dehydrogenase (NADP(+)) [Clostridia bacterium]|nr:shikimate dehydrogenase (NADP(+)) [Clostridia bacterium]
MNLNITGTTRLLGLLGRPVSHSKSPQIHNLSFERLGLDYVYLNFDIAPAELENAVNAMRVLNVLGFNVTMPHKKNVMKYLDEITDEARLIDAVNTVANAGGRLVGYNTDGRGFVKVLSDNGVKYENEKITLCGAGGAGRSVAVALAFSGVSELSVFDIDKESAENLADTLNNNTKTKARAFLCEENELVSHIKDSSVFIHATGLGMHPHLGKSVLGASAAKSAFRESLTVADLIYDPSPTELLRLAAENGAKTADGREMLYNQGAYAFKIWTGLDMPLDYVKKNIR